MNGYLPHQKNISKQIYFLHKLINTNKMSSYQNVVLTGWQTGLSEW